MKDIQLVCFDIDGTLIQQNSWEVLNRALGVTAQEDSDMYHAYGRGELPYDIWIGRLAALYKERGKASKEVIEKALFGYELVDGAEELIVDLRAKGYELALVSGSFSILVAHLAARLDITHYKGNAEIQFDSNGMLSEVVVGGDEPQAKLAYVQGLCAELGIPVTACACIGDGANDLELFRATGNGITFSDAPDEVQRAAQCVVQNLREASMLL